MAWMMPGIDKCEDFIDEEGQKEVTIVVAPLRVVEDYDKDGRKIEKVFWGCSRFFHCQNGTCEYSARSRDERKKARSLREEG